MKWVSDFVFLPWLAMKLLRQDHRQWLSPTGWVALGGLILGVASLVVSMAVVSGFETTLQKAVSEVGGEIQILRIGPDRESWGDLFKRVQRIDPAIVAGVPFVSVEAVIAHNGKLTGISVQGVGPEQVRKVLGLHQRVIEGKFQISSGTDQPPEVVVGQGLARNHQLKVGDVFRVVVPLPSDLDPSQMRRKVVSLKLAGVLDLGKHEYNERMIIAPLDVTQDMAEIGDRFLGVLLKTRHPGLADEVALNLGDQLGREYRIRTWREVNENLFEAVSIERVVLFFIILLIVVAAAFNVATMLYVNVVQKYSSVAILKTLGLSPRQLIAVFSWQGLALGFFGSVLGLVLGLFFCLGFSWLEANFGILPGGVYKIDGIQIDLRWSDLSLILVTTMAICFLAVFAPARQGMRLSIVEGLRYE